MNRPDRIWNYVDGHNDGRHPDPLGLIRDASEAVVIHLFHEVRPPILDDDAETQARAMARIRQLIADGDQAASAQLAPLLVSLRHRLRLSRRELVRQLCAELGLLETCAPKFKHYYADLENGLLSASRLAPELFAAIGRVLAVDPEELRGAARFSMPFTEPEARAFARVVNAARTLPVVQRAATWDRVDALFLGARSDES